ncbi:hypothetical protein UB46_34080 [Burkholderiaceae bacterium 16]|nr:hypothetical protein UB46_34080 [Burkholderiaceae bacterium 16]
MVPGILKLACKALVNDRARFTGLLVGITFAVFLMIAVTSLFAGALNRSSSTMYNIGASIRVMDPAVTVGGKDFGINDHRGVVAGYHRVDIGYLQARLQRMRDTAALFLALGGGWDAGAAQAQARRP